MRKRPLAGTDAVYRYLLIFISHGMEGNEPTPISRGVEIQAEKMKEIKEWALARHAEITRLGAIVEERREQEMAKPLEQRDATKMLKFEEQDHALNELSQQLDDLIHGAWNMEDATRPSPVSTSNTSRRETLLRIRRLVFS